MYLSLLLHLEGEMAIKICSNKASMYLQRHVKEGVICKKMKAIDGRTKKKLFIF